MNCSGGVATLERPCIEVGMPVTATIAANRNAHMSTDLVKGLKRRDPWAFEQLVARHGPMLYRVAARFMGRREDAEEVVQETLLTVYEKIDTFDEQAALTTWLYRVVVNTALMRLRAKSRTRETPLEWEGPAVTPEGDLAQEVNDWDLSPEDALLREETRTVLREGVDRLPDLYRSVYVLAEIEGVPHQEVATLLGLTVATVKTRLHRARLFLREALSDYFGDLKQHRAELLS